MPHIVIYDTNEAGLGAIAAAKRLGHRVTFVDHLGARFYPVNERSRGIVASADRVIEREWLTRPEVAVEVLAGIHRDEPIDAALTTNELSVDPLAHACARLRLRFTHADAVSTARRKHRLRARLAECGIPSARYAVLEAGEEPTRVARRIGYPVVVKPSSGALSLLAGVANDDAELLQAVERLRAGLATLPESWREQYDREILLEERLNGELVSVEIGRSGGRVIPFMVSGRYRARQDETFELGSVVPADLPEPVRRRCLAYAETVLDAVGLDIGIFHLEMILTGSGPILVEANPRIMGGPLPLMYNMSCARDIFEDLVSIHLGITPPEPIWPDRRAVGGMLFVTASAGVVKSSLDHDAARSALAEIGSELVRFELTDRGHAVAARQPIGRAWVAGQSPSAVMSDARRILQQVAGTCGLPLYD